MNPNAETKCARRIFTCCLSLVLSFLTVASNSDVFAQSSSVRSQVIQPHPVNLDFEQGNVGQVPDGWDCPTKINYAVEVTEDQPKSGKRAALLRTVPTTTATGFGFGNLMQAFDATAFRGKRYYQ